MDILEEFPSRFSSKANNFLRLLPYALSLYWSNDRSLCLFLDSDRQRQNRRRREGEKKTSFLVFPPLCGLSHYGNSSFISFTFKDSNDQIPYFFVIKMNSMIDWGSFSRLIRERYRIINL